MLPYLVCRAKNPDMGVIGAFNLAPRGTWRMTGRPARQGRTMSNNVIDIDDQMLADFRDEASEIVSSIGVHLQNAHSKADPAILTAIQREVFNLRSRPR